MKRGPGRPRRYTAPTQQNKEDSDITEPSENKPIEVNILSIQAEEDLDTEAAEDIKESPKKEKVNLGQVLELAVQSMSVTMETEEEEGDMLVVKDGTQSTNTTQPVQASQDSLPLTRMTFESTEDQDSDFEWKLDNEEETVSHSPPTKKKKLNASYIVPTVILFYFFQFHWYV